MGYQLHIEKKNDLINLDEWLSVTENIKNIRQVSNNDIVLPSGKIISMGIKEGDIEVLIDNKWIPFLTFSNGIGSFNYTEEFEDENNPIKKIVFEIAKKLNAQIVGDEGEIY